MRKPLCNHSSPSVGAATQGMGARARLPQSRPGSPDFLLAVIDSLDADLMVLDRSYRVTQTNLRVASGRAREQVIGRRCYEVARGAAALCARFGDACPVANVWQTGEPTHAVRGLPGTGTAGERFFEVSAAPIRDTEGNVAYVVETTREVTMGIGAERRGAAPNRLLMGLLSVAGRLGQTDSLEALLRSALGHVLEKVQADCGGILLLQKGHAQPTCITCRGLPEPFLEASLRRRGSGLLGRVALTGEAVSIADLTRRRSAECAELKKRGLRSFLALPLRCGAATVGLLAVATREPRPFSPEEVQILGAFGDQVGVAIENARLHRELQLGEQTRTDLLRRVIRAQEDERRRVARDLHDVTSQALATLCVHLECALAEQGKGASDRAPGRVLASIRPLLDRTSQEIHRLIQDLRPCLLDDLGLAPAIRSVALGALRAAGVRVDVEVAGRERRLPPDIETAVFRIAQEAVTNIVRHARAESACITLDFAAWGIRLQVEDDGVGYDAEAARGTEGASSMGIAGMRERTELLGGSLSISGTPGRGTRLAVEIPMGGEANA